MLRGSEAKGTVVQKQRSMALPLLLAVAVAVLAGLACLLVLKAAPARPAANQGKRGDAGLRTLARIHRVDFQILEAAWFAQAAAFALVCDVASLTVFHTVTRAVLMAFGIRGREWYVRFWQVCEAHVSDVSKPNRDRSGLCISFVRDLQAVQTFEQLRPMTIDNIVKRLL